jgi:hypothetical protein
MMLPPSSPTEPPHRLDRNLKYMRNSHASQVEPVGIDHRTAAHTRWIAAEIQDALDDLRPSLPHEEVTATMGAVIEAVEREAVAAHRQSGA